MNTTSLLLTFLLLLTNCSPSTQSNQIANQELVETSEDTITSSSPNTDTTKLFAPLDSINASMKMENIGRSFLNMDQYFLSKKLVKSENPFVFPMKEQITLPGEFYFDETTFNTAKYIDSSDTQGFLVIQNDSIVYEKYWKGQQRNTKHIAWSMSKSYVSALLGISISEGFIKSVQEPINNYLPELKGTGYDGVKIKDILEMSSGIKFDETYSDPNSDISRWWMGFCRGESQDAFAATLTNERPPGTYNQYVSINTHILGMLLVRATGQSITDYMQQKLWTPLGAEFDAYWLSDRSSMEMALGGLNATLRDFGKLGQLYLHQGKWGDQQLVSKEWIRESTTPSADHLRPQSKQSASPGIGYAYQWWIPDGDQGELLAIGVFNQYIYINPTTQTVIVKNSANRNYYDGANPYRDTGAHLELFRRIAEGK